MMDVKQLLRIAWNGLVAVSALLFVATLISVRSYSTSDSFGYVWGPDIGKHVAMISFSRAYFRAQSLHDPAGSLAGGRSGYTHDVQPPLALREAAESNSGDHSFSSFHWGTYTYFGTENQFVTGPI